MSRATPWRLAFSTGPTTSPSLIKAKSGLVEWPMVLYVFALILLGAMSRLADGIVGCCSYPATANFEHWQSWTY